MTAVALAAATVFSQAVAAMSVFLPAGDVRLRDDIALLADRRLVDLPVNEWPLAVQDVADALSEVDSSQLTESALVAAYARVQGAVRQPADAGSWKLRELRVTGGQQALLRDQGTLGRENGELTAVGGVRTARYGITLSATGVLDASDGQSVRLDGSDVSIRWGNWLFSVNQMDRWWGPGRDGSLILSTNARPMPAVSLDRVRTLPFDVPVLRWLGPWRFSAFVGLGERYRVDVDQPLFMGMRASFKPVSAVEIGLSRSAQFCGKQRACDLRTFGRLLIGQDNVGRRGLEDPDDEPGNQMSGFDARLVSPWRAVPVALYGQLIGEDNSASSLPIRYMYLGGVEVWRTFEGGAVLRAHLEHADTSTGIYKLFRPDDPAPEFAFDYGYRNHIFFGGYRNRGRNIGHTTDADSETTSLGMSLTDDGGGRWSALVRRGRLDRFGTADSYNSVTSGPSDYRSVQVGWEGSLLGQQLGAQFGHQRQWSAGEAADGGWFGYLRWQVTLN